MRAFRSGTGIAVVAGATGAGAQVVLLRELLVACGGNELAAGVALACWLLGTALGSGVGGLLVRRWSGPGLAGGLLLALAAALAGSMWGVELARGWLGPGPGEVVPLAGALLICAAVLVLPCVLLGVLFPVLVALVGGRQPAARVFALEALGFGAAGLVFGLGLLVVVPAPLAMAGVAAALCGASMWLAPQRSRARAWIGAGVVAALCVATLVPRVGRSSMFRGRPALQADSLHSRIEVVTDGELHNVYLDGLWAFATPDAQAAQWATHPAMLLHPAPERVLLIGGALSGVLPEVLEHPSVQHVDAVELDPALVGVLRGSLPGLEALDDPRVALHLLDGRAFVRRAEGPYDVVLLALPDPHSAQLARFYSVEFFEQLRDRLAHGGMVVAGVRGSADMLGPTQARYAGATRTTLAQVFGRITALPGARIVYVASDQDVVLQTDVMGRRLEERGIDAEYVTPFDLTFELGPLREQYLLQVLAETSVDLPSRDLAPTCFHLGNVLWASQQAPWLGSVLTWVEGLRVRWLVAAVLGLAALLALAAWVRPARRVGRGAAVRAAVAVAGGTGMAVEVCVILGYQVAFGHLAARIGLVVAAYMLGLAGGATLAGRLIRARWDVVALQLGLAGGCALLAGLATLPGATSLPGWCQLLFVAVPAGTGLVAGAQFPRAVILAGGDETAGGLYAWDLAGAALTSLAVSILLLPVYGLSTVLALAAVANTAVAAVVLTLPRTPG